MATGSVRGARRWYFGVTMGVLLGLVGPQVAPADEGGADRPAARLVAADAVIFVEMPKPTALIDRLTDERLVGPVNSIPSVRNALESDRVRHIKDVAGLVAGKLGKSPEQVLRDLTGGGLVFAAGVVDALPSR